MTDVRLVLEGVTRGYGSRPVLQNLSAEVRAGGTLVVTGCNGAGKSTLLALAAGLISPDEGAVRYLVDGSELLSDRRRDFLRRRVALVAPELSLYGELSAMENLEFFARVRGYAWDRERALALLDRLGLKSRRRDLLGTYSSGMRVRMRYAVALFADPPVLLLDEPTALLDEAGAAFVEEVIAEQRARGLLLLATNDAREIRHGDAVLHLERVG